MIPLKFFDLNFQENYYDSSGVVSQVGDGLRNCVLCEKKRREKKLTPLEATFEFQYIENDV